MSYFLSAFIGTNDILKRIDNEYLNSRIVVLNEQISMIPLTDKLINELCIKTQTAIDLFENLTNEIEQSVLKLVGNEKLGYFESEFFGGFGGHICILWENKSVEFVSEFKINSLNKLISQLFDSNNDVDYFTILGLDKFRDTEQWTK